MRTVDRITYYDIVSLQNSLSFFLAGFYTNQKRYGYRFSVRHCVPSILRDLSLNPVRQNLLRSLGILLCKVGGDEFYICIDRGDHATTTRGEGYDTTVLERVRYYFKINFNREAIENDPVLQRFRAKIFPLNPGFPLRMSRLPFFMPRPAAGKRAEWSDNRPRQRIFELIYRPTLGEIRHLRKAKTDIDVFFVMMFYGEAHHAHISDVRYEVMRELKRRPEMNVITGFASSRELPDKYDLFRIKPFTPRNYLKHLARSKVAIYVRGAHNCISAKFGHYIALGKPICGQTIYNNAENLYDNDHFKEQFAYETPIQIVDRAVELLQQASQRKHLAESNARTFDTKYSPEIVVSNILKTILGELRNVRENKDAKNTSHVQ